MVTYVQLRDATPDLWQTAADDLLAVAKQSERSADNIHANGIRPLEESWADATGNLARGTLVTVANRMVNAGVLARGATSALDALQDALAIAQRQLNSAVADAQVHGFLVGENGRLDFAPGTLVDAAKARTALGPLFDSAQPAADGNPGFATGAKLVKYAASLRKELAGTITDLETTGTNIMASAQTMSATDQETATGASRIVTALNGLGRPPK